MVGGLIIWGCSGFVFPGKQDDVPLGEFKQWTDPSRYRVGVGGYRDHIQSNEADFEDFRMALGILWLLDTRQTMRPL